MRLAQRRMKLTKQQKSNRPAAKSREHALLAAALSYDPALMEAPMVAAISRGELAKSFRRIARRYGIPIKTDENLAKSLLLLGENKEIPEELYAEVAELLSCLKKR